MASEGEGAINCEAVADDVANVGVGDRNPNSANNEFPAKRLASSDLAPAKEYSAPKKRVVLRHLMSAGSANADDTSKNVEDTSVVSQMRGSGESNTSPGAGASQTSGRLRSIGVRLPTKMKSSDVLDLMPSFGCSRTQQVGSILSESVGLGVFKLDPEEQVDTEKGAIDATKLAIWDALNKRSLHLNDNDGGERLFVSIRLGVPDVILGRLPFVDFRQMVPPCLQIVSLSAGIGGMYVPAATTSGECGYSSPSPASPSPVIVVVASVAISSTKIEDTKITSTGSSDVNEAVSKSDLIRRLFDQENEIKSLKAQLTANRVNEMYTSPGTSIASQSINNPWVHPTANACPQAEKVPARSGGKAVISEGTAGGAGVKSPDSALQEVVYEQGSFLKPSSRAESNSTSAAMSSGSFAESIASPSQAGGCDGHTAKLDQLVVVMDREEEREVENNYHDYVSLSDDFLEDQKATFEHSQTDLMLLSKRVSFPVKVMIMLEDVHLKKKTNIVAWMPHGRCVLQVLHVHIS